MPHAYNTLSNTKMSQTPVFSLSRKALLIKIPEMIEWFFYSEPKVLLSSFTEDLSPDFQLSLSFPSWKSEGFAVASCFLYEPTYVVSSDDQLFKATPPLSLEVQAAHSDHFPGEGRGLKVE